ncbi:MAG: DNA-processing protein DprA [Rhodospirillales bacterium]|nr:DNA-processing protein DprA [Rhodospirillales bacterium]MCW9002273.1 DNA-processing protein DprA [Rhodospirillales bacterium]
MTGDGVSLNHAEKRDRLRLIRSANIGPITFHRLIERFGSAAAAIDALPRLPQRGGKRPVTLCPSAEAEQEMEALDRLGGAFVFRGEATYPTLLDHIEDAPPVLSVMGDVGLLNARAVGIVGARNASINGCRFATRMAEAIGQGGFVVVSGLARGIDTAAHEGALNTGTIAVVAGGVDVTYPRENAKLQGRIAECGAVVSEQPLGTTPQARHFPLRNRLISGLSEGVVVIEAGERSGSLITARMALEQGREVFAVPGGPTDPRSHGANRLIREGAILTERADDILSAIETPLLSRPFFQAPQRKTQQTETIDLFDEPPGPADIGSTTESIIDLLGPEPLSVDELIRRCQLSPAVVASALLEVELSGRLERHPGNRVSLIARADE